MKSKGRKMYVYVGYPKGIAKDCFGSHKEDKMFVKFLMMTMWIILKQIVDCSRRKMSEFVIRQL